MTVGGISTLYDAGGKIAAEISKFLKDFFTVPGSDASQHKTAYLIWRNVSQSITSVLCKTI